MTNIPKKYQNLLNEFPFLTLVSYGGQEYVGIIQNIDNNLAQQIILKLHKQRMDAYNIYVEQNRSDLADEEFQQAKVLKNYLPKRLSEEEIRSKIKEITNVLGATSMADMGKVMGKAMNSLKGKADGAIISKLVKEILK